MATAEVAPPPAEAATPALPDYLVDPNAVMNDDAQWRYGRAPDYSNTRRVWEETKSRSHEAASLPNLVENLVKNWEVEASFKSNIDDWRTIDRPNYTFAINGGPPQSAEHMLKVGTYNAIIAPNQYYSPENSDFASSHKTFKRMMPTFAWEVLEVYSGPPVVAFRWRHWGTMKNDYVGFNDKGEKVTAKAHGGPINIEGVTVAKVDDKVRLQSVETWFDPLEMFRQIAPKGIVNKTIVSPESEEAVSSQPAANDSKPTAEEPHAQHPEKDSQTTEDKKENNAAQVSSDAIVAVGNETNVNTSQPPNTDVPQDNITSQIFSDDDHSSQGKKDMVTASGTGTEELVAAEKDAKLTPGTAIVEPKDSEAVAQVHEELSRISVSECPFLMNRE